MRYAVTLAGAGFLLLAAGCNSEKTQYNDSPGAAVTTAVTGSQRQWTPASCDALKPIMQRALIDYFTTAAPTRCLDCGASARVATGDGVPGQYASDLFVNDALVTNLNPLAPEVRSANGYVYAVAGAALVVYTESLAGERTELTRVFIANAAAQLALDATGQRLLLVAPRMSPRSPALVFGDAFPPTGERRAIDPMAAIPRTEMLYVDVADPLRPNPVRKISLRGGLLTAASTTSGVTLVVRRGWPLRNALIADADFMQAISAYWSARANGASTQVAADEIQARIEAAVASATITDLAPEMMDTGYDAERANSLLTCNDVAAPEAQMTTPELVAVAAFDWNGDLLDRAAVLDGGVRATVRANQVEIFRPLISNATLDGTDTTVYRFAVTPARVYYLGERIAGSAAASGN